MGTIFNIQKFCVNDGPGIRTTVFLKGCPLHCAWCHNPESQSKKPELSYSASLCVSCGKCVPLCPKSCHSLNEEGHRFDRTLCVSCGKCVNVYCNALSVYGYESSADEIIADVMKDKAFYEKSGGGMTLSGGEPLYQPDFCLELLKIAKENGIHTCIETCGFASGKGGTIEKTAPYIDMYLFDFKESDSKKHKLYTGVDNSLLLENLHFIDSMGKKIILRCPIIPAINDRPDHFEAIASLASSLKNVVKIEVEPYHSLGEGKYQSLGKDYTLKGHTSVPNGEVVGKWINAIADKTDIETAKG